MGLRFRKRIKTAPGIHLNIGKTGVSTSLGGKGLTVNLGRGKTRSTVGIPGTGLSYTSTTQKSDSNTEGAGPRLVWFLVAAVVLVLLALLSTSFAFAADWEVVRKQGTVYLVVVDKNRYKDVSVYRAVIAALCKPGAYCDLIFWKDRKLVPRTWPMTDQQRDAIVAQYTLNPSTRFEELLLSCEIMNDPAHCI